MNWGDRLDTRATAPIFMAIFNQLRLVKQMAYTLLYSRQIKEDAVLRVTDIPIPDRSVMIELLSIASPFRRLAGFAYPLRSDGLRDYERGLGVTLPFGKNRVNFATATPPYFLEFFPRWGIKTAIISVYTGEPNPPAPSDPGWKQAPSGPYQLKLIASPAGISFRTSPTDEAVAPALNGAVSGLMVGTYVYWKKSDGLVQLAEIGTFYPVYVGTAADYDTALSNPNRVLL